MGLLEDTSIAENFLIKLQNRFQALQDTENEDGTIDVRWLHSKDVFNKTCEETIGKKQTKHKE